jgi:two-component system chemotaxis response regulator CheB
MGAPIIEGMNRDVIVIGASAGGLEVLLEMVSQLPRNLPAALFVVIHRHPNGPALLPELLSERGPLTARHPLHGERTEPGTIYIAPPDNHLWVRNGSVEVVRGPKENGHRPAVDALFRTASVAYGPRVVGVVLSGHQDCGTAGTLSIKARGGVSVVQAPDTASARDMPENVLRRVRVDHVVPPSELAPLLVQLANSEAAPAANPEGFVQQLEGQLPGQRADLVCPTCQGVLTEAQSGAFEHYRCHVGHAFTLESLVREQSESMERALWAAVRVLEESAGLNRRLSAKESGELGERFSEKASTQQAQAELIRSILLHGAMLSPEDAATLA